MIMTHHGTLAQVISVSSVPFTPFLLACDQHVVDFPGSLLQAATTRGYAPYDAICPT